MSTKPSYLRSWSSIVLLLLMVLLLFFRFPDFFQSANSKVIEPWGDGYKAYTVIQYHVLHDSTYSHFQGMNYPFGEHVIPAATQPLLSNTIKWFSRNVVDISGYSVGILNFSLLLGLLFCAVFLFLILRRMELPVWYAMAAAVVLTFLAPQFIRMKSHYGLAHPEVLPVVLYLLMRYYEKPGLGRSLWITVATAAFSLIHFYYFAIIAFTVSFFFLFHWLQNPRLRRLLPLGLHYGVQIILPLLWFTWWMNDGIADRTDYPWGFFEFHAIWESIFTSLLQPHFQWVDEQVIRIEQVSFEGQAYVGLPAVIMTVIILGRWAGSLFRRPPVELGGSFSRFWQSMFYASVVVLLFSFGYPFTIPGLEGWLDHTGPLRQFRSVGRFAWLFYYVINILAAVWIFEWSRKGRNWRKAVPVALLLVLAWEGLNYQQRMDLRLDEIPEWREGQRYTELAGIDYNNFQAVVPLPYYNVGSDNFWGYIRGMVGQKSLTLSVQTGLPTTGAMLTRTSLSETMKQFQLVTEPYRPPALLDDFPSDRSLLLVYNPEEVKQFGGNYDHLLWEARLLFENPPVQFYELPLVAFEKILARRRWEVANELEVDRLYAVGELLSRDSVAFFYFNAFDSLTAQRKYLGAGAYEGAMRDTNVLLDDALPRHEGGREYTVSFWIYAAQDLAARTDVELLEYHPADGRTVQSFKTRPHWFTNVFDPNGWVLVEIPFRLQESGTRVRLTFRNPHLGRHDRLWVDELLIRPAGVNLYRETVEYFWKDNRHFRKD